MANPYIYNVVTLDGAALIAQATAANPIVYVAALSKSTAAESDADLSTKPAAWYDGKVGDIAAVSATLSVARIVAVWRNDGTAQPAKALAVTARLASQTDADAVVVTAMSDPESSVTLPGEDDVQGGVEVPFNVVLNAGDDVAVTPGASASIADLDRFVSMFRAGDPTQGEAQSILGEKSFLAPVTKCRSIEPSAYGASSEHCGSAAAPFFEAYTNTLKVGAVEAIENPNYAITLNSSLVPSANGKNFGTFVRPFGSVSCETLYLCEDSENHGVLYFSVTGGRGYIWTSTNISPEDVDMWLGSPDYRWGTVWAENFNGCIPYYSYSGGDPLEEPKVGAIVLIYITLGSLMTGMTLEPGQQVHSQGPNDVYFTGVYAAQMGLDGALSQYPSSPRFSGTYSLLSAALSGGSLNDQCCALAIRVA